MYRFFVKETASRLDGEIDVVIDRMKQEGPDSDQYPKLMGMLERLEELKAKERPKKVSRDTMFIVIGNLVGVAAILLYEDTHVITSKAMSQLYRPK